MFEFMHDIYESWILAAASSGLGAFRRSLLEGHLGSCQRCRGFALDLVEFSHAAESEKRAAPKFTSAEQAELHASVMAAFHRERNEERLGTAARPVFARAAGPLVRPAFAKAMAVLALLLASVTVLTWPYRHGAETGAVESSASLHQDALPTPEPSPSPTADIRPQPSPVPTQSTR